MTTTVDIVEEVVTLEVTSGAVTDAQVADSIAVHNALSTAHGFIFGGVTGFGISPSVSLVDNVYIAENIAATLATAGSKVGTAIRGQWTVTATGAQSDTLYGVQGYILNSNTGTLSVVHANDGVADNAAGGTITVAEAVTGRVYNRAAGSIGYAYGFAGRVINLGSGTISNAYAGYFNYALNSGGGVITNNYGIYIEPQTAGSALNYSIYGNAGLYRFGDQLSIIGNADRVQLSIVGNLTQTSSLQTWSNSTPTVVASLSNLGYFQAARVGAGGAPLYLIHAPGYLLTSPQLVIGSMEFQSAVFNNGWMSENFYFDGSQFRLRADGFGHQIKFRQGEFQIQLYNTGTAGDIPAGNIVAKWGYDGSFAVGAAVAQGIGVYTSAKFLINAAGSVLIGTLTDGMTAAGSLAIAKDLAHRGTLIGFNNATPVVKQTGYAVPTEINSCIAALTTLRTALINYGLITTV